MWALSHVALLGSILRAGIFWALFFAVIRQGSRGVPGIESPDFSDLWSDVVRPALLGFLGLAVIWVPGLVWISLRPGGPFAPIVLDPVLLVLVIAGALYAPMALLHAAVGGSTLGMLNPVGIMGAAVRLGRDYLIAFAVLAILAMLGVGVEVLAGATLGSLPVISGIAREFVGLLAPVIIARVLGLLLYVRGDDLGLGMPEDYLEPVLAGAVPRGTPQAQAGSSHAPAGQPADPAPRVDAIELDPPAGPAEGTPSPVAQISAEVQRGNLATAARLFAALRAPSDGLSGQILFQVAKGAATSGDHALAAHALEAAARTEDPAVAPDALLVLGRIYLQRLAQPARGKAVLQQLVARYPKSVAAAHARKLLAPEPAN
jgi:hypothetical protein